MILDGLNIEDLAGDEGSVISMTDIKDTPPETIPNTPPKETPKSNIDEGTEEDNSGIDLEDFANAEVVSNTNNDEETEGAATKEGNPSSLATFTSLATALTEAGAFSSLTEEELSQVTDVETLLAAVSKEIKNNEFRDLNESQKNYLESLRHGIPKEEFVQTESSAAQYRAITDEQIEATPALQVELLRREFLTKGFTPEKAANYASLAMQSESAVEDALNARNALVAHEESNLQTKISAKKAELAAKEESNKQTLSSIKEKLDSTPEIIPGIKINAVTKERVYNSLTAPVSEDNGEPLNEVMKLYKEDTEFKLRLHTLFTVTNGLKDFSKFTNISKTDAVKKLSNVLNSNTGLGSSSRTGITSKQMFTGSMSAKDIANALPNFKK